MFLALSETPHAVCPQSLQNPQRNHFIDSLRYLFLRNGAQRGQFTGVNIDESALSGIIKRKTSLPKHRHHIIDNRSRASTLKIYPIEVSVVGQDIAALAVAIHETP